MPSIVIDNQASYYAYHQPNPLSAPPLVLLHGAGGTHLYWPPHLRRLPGVPIYTPDLPGHGRSAGRGYNRIADYRAWLCAFVDALALPPFVLAGHSMGGALALDFALTHPDRLVGLGLVGTNARLRVAPAILQGIQQDFRATTEQLVGLMYGPKLTQAKRLTYLQRLREADQDVLYGDFSACDAFDVSAWVGEITLPTLLICGRQDQMTPAKYSERLHDQIRTSELHLLDQAGHMVMLEQPQAVTQLFAQFLRNLTY